MSCELALGEGYVFSEKDWNVWSGEANGDYYGLAKTRAEEIAHKAAEHAQDRKAGYDVVCINPSIVFGQCLTKAHTKASPVFVRQLLLHNAQPDVYLNWVDVLDVADAHVAALKVPQAGGQRFLITGDAKTNSGRFPGLASTIGGLYDKLDVKAVLMEGLLYSLAWQFSMSEFEQKTILTDIHLDNRQSKSVLGLRYSQALSHIIASNSEHTIYIDTYILPLCVFLSLCLETLCNNI